MISHSLGSVFDTILCHYIYQLLGAGQWFSLGTQIVATNQIKGSMKLQILCDCIGSCSSMKNADVLVLLSHSNILFCIYLEKTLETSTNMSLLLFYRKMNQ